MEKSNKKQTKVFILILIGVSLLIILPTMINASLYDHFNSLKDKNCRIITNGYTSSTNLLIDKFNLDDNSLADCTFVLDAMPYSQDTIDLTNFLGTDYSEIDYLVRGDQDYIFLLGKDAAALEDTVNLAVDYENQQIMKEQDSLLLPEVYFSLGPIPEDHSWDGCVDNSLATPYTSNQASFGQPVETLSSFCDPTSKNKNGKIELIFPYCVGGSLEVESIYCDCLVDRCLVSPSEILYWIKNLGNTDRFARGIITPEFVNSVINSWINQ